MNKQALTALALSITLLTGCSGRVATTAPDPAPQPSQSPDVQQEQSSQSPDLQQDQSTQTPGGQLDQELKTGLSVLAWVSESEDAEAGEDGLVQTDLVLAAVTVDDQGVIRQCVIDGVRAAVHFNERGELVTPAGTQFPSKNELGRDYGMHKASSLDKDWSEQAAAFADYVTGKTAAEVSGIAITPEGAPIDVDLASSVTVDIGDFIAGVEAAAANAAHLGAREGDRLKLVALADGGESVSAIPEGVGTAQVEASLAAVTLRKEVITSCILDSVSTTVTFDPEGDVEDIPDTPVLTKNQLGANYGMAQASSIGLEWDQQAAAFAAYATGKTLRELGGIAVDEAGKPTGADLTASVTISIGEFQTLLAKAAG